VKVTLIETLRRIDRAICNWPSSARRQDRRHRYRRRRAARAARRVSLDASVGLVMNRTPIIAPAGITNPTRST
jgi:hypothetical protein